LGRFHQHPRSSISRKRDEKLFLPHSTWQTAQRFGKWRTGVNFINILRTNFLYELHISAAFSSYMYVEKRRSYEKFVRIMLMKLTPGLANSHMFGEQPTDFSLQIQQNDLTNFVKVSSRRLVKLNDNFFAKRCALATFCLAHKVW